MNPIILKTTELILLQIGAIGLWGHGDESINLRSKVKGRTRLK